MEEPGGAQQDLDLGFFFALIPIVKEKNLRVGQRNPSSNSKAD